MAESDWERLWEGYEERFNHRRGEAQGTYRCAWSDRTIVVSDLLRRQHSDFNFMYCAGVTVTPAGDADPTTGGPKTAIIRATFTTEPDWVNNDMNTWEERWEGGGEGITLGEGFKWSDTNEPVRAEDNVGAVKLFPHVTLTLTGRTDKDTAIGKDYIFNCLGKVNSDTITLKGYAYSAETLLFLGADLQEGKDSEGNTVTILTYKFGAKRDHTWNHFWRERDTKKPPNPPGFYRMVDSKGNPPFSDAIFSDLDPQNW